MYYVGYRKVEVHGSLTVPQAQPPNALQLNQQACGSYGHILWGKRGIRQVHLLLPHRNLQKLHVLDIRAGDVKSPFNILMTSSGANSIAMGITTFWKAYIYSASPMPFSGQGIFTELPEYLETSSELFQRICTYKPSPGPSPQDCIPPNGPQG